jgi:nicotinamide mononucleotide (NMN) deamidase PncC
VAAWLDFATTREATASTSSGTGDCGVATGEDGHGVGQRWLGVRLRTDVVAVFRQRVSGRRRWRASEWRGRSPSQSGRIRRA